MNFKKWLNEQSYAGIEDADSSQIERVYKKSRLAVKIVQDYDKQTGNNYLTNITTIAPISKAGIFGLYNSAENKAIIGKPYNQQKFTFSQEELDKMANILTHFSVTSCIEFRLFSFSCIQPTNTIKFTR